MGKKTILTQSLHMLLALIEGLIGLRVVLKLFGANPQAPFVAWVYQTTAALLAPFEGMFASPGQDGFVLEFSSLFAMLFYAFMWYLFFEVLDVFDSWREAREQREAEKAMAANVRARMPVAQRYPSGLEERAYTGGDGQDRQLVEG